MQALAIEQPESWHAGRLVAALEQPLHSQTDSEQRAPASRMGTDSGTPFVAKRQRGAIVADARNDDAVTGAEIVGRGGYDHCRADRSQRLFDRCQIPCAVVDEADLHHRRPLVLGSMRASRGSLAHATRSARAKALNTASI